MDKKIIVGIVFLLLVVGVIVFFVPGSEDNNVNTDANINGVGANDMGERPPMNEGVNSEDERPVIDGENGMMPPMDREVSVNGEIPQEAVDACIELSEGDDCSFVAPRGEVVNTCKISEEVLACGP